MNIRKAVIDNECWTWIEDKDRKCMIHAYWDDEKAETVLDIDGDRELIKEYVGQRGLHLFIEELQDQTLEEPEYE